jgi:hypothetical protein
MAMIRVIGWDGTRYDEGPPAMPAGLRSSWATSRPDCYLLRSSVRRPVLLMLLTRTTTPAFGTLTLFHSAW